MALTVSPPDAAQPAPPHPRCDGALPSVHPVCMQNACNHVEPTLSPKPALAVPDLAGVHAAIVCPMSEDGAIAVDDLARHAQAVGQTPGIAGFLVNGHAGEGHLLSPDEKRRVLMAVRAVVPPGRHISAGVTAEATDAACREAEVAAGAGADSVLVFPPSHWCRGADAGTVVEHHRTVAMAAGLPVVIYRAPLSWGALSYGPDLIARLVELDAVAAIKEGSWDVAAYEEVWRLVKRRAPQISVMASGDEHLLACFQVGTDGSQVSLAALFPELVVDLFAAARNQDWPRARELHERVYPLACAIYRRPPGYMATARLKAGLKLLGRIASDRTKRPGRQLDAAELEALASVLHAA